MSEIADPHWVAYGKVLEEKKAFIKHCLDVWVPIMALHDWDISLTWCPSPPDQWSHDSAADCTSKWEYKWAEIRFFMSKLDLSDETLETILVHELCHVLVSQMRRGIRADKNEERVVTELSKSFIRARLHNSEIRNPEE